MIVDCRTCSYSVLAERAFTDARVKKIIDFKKQVCKDGEGFILINQKGIDPISLDALARENIVALRRAKVLFAIFTIMTS